ncbi:hypothetical protein Tco_0633727 [Tanacetum coccineum]
MEATAVYSTEKILKLVSSKEMRKGSIVQLTKFKFGYDSKHGRTLVETEEGHGPPKTLSMPVTVKALNVICSKCDIIGDPKPFYDHITYTSFEDDFEDDSEPDQNEDCLAPTQKDIVLGRLSPSDGDNHLTSNIPYLLPPENT